MVHLDYICDACGFTSQEEQGVYKCPVCGNQMRIAKGGHSGDSNPTFARLLIYVLEFIFVLPILFVFLAGIPGIIVFIIILFLTRRWLNNRYKNKAIRTTPNMSIKNPNKIYTCNSCGNNFKGQRPTCPHCGIRLTYND